MTSANPLQRPTAADISNHPFFWHAARALNFLQDVRCGDCNGNVFLKNIGTFTARFFAFCFDCIYPFWLLLTMDDLIFH